MPFRSEKQRRYLWMKHPKMAQKWTDEHGSKPVKKKKGGTPWYLGPYKRAQKIDKYLEQLKKKYPKLPPFMYFLKPPKPAEIVAGLSKKPPFSKVEKVKKKRRDVILNKHGGDVKIWGKPVEKQWPSLNKDQKDYFKKKWPDHVPDDAIPKKKSGGSMDPYYGSYIKGRVDGKTLSNPSYRKYYKGLI